MPVLLGLVVLAACQGARLELPDASVAPEEAWRMAEELWRRRDFDAHRSWLAVDPNSRQGREARRRLSRADQRYREGVRRLERGEPGARDALLEGVAIAPMDPALYLPLARACRARGLEVRAEDYYKKFLRLRPDHPQAPAARLELGALDPELQGIFEPEPSQTPAPAVPIRPPPSVSLVPAFAAGAIAFAAAVALFARLFRRGLPLARLAAESPELQPSIAYLVSSVRHELLKHRIGAIGDAVRALGKGEATAEQRAFLAARLYGGEPLVLAWRGHVRAFERALGPRLDLRRADRGFREAGRAIGRIAALERALAAGDARAAERLAWAHRKLLELDADLAALATRLVRTTVDEVLLEEVVREVRSEYAAGRVELDALVIGPVAPGVSVEVFRFDLVLVLKNVVRNAILAVGRSAPPRRIALDVGVELEPTGEEAVRVRVRDTSTEALTTEAIYERRVDRGLGLVTAALTRYDGAIEVEAGSQGWAKGVTVRLFRALQSSSGVAS
ncbi:MAG: hypothetical protein HYY06_26515 [Deltaproteobacteria bacterium]|nr:hypothetical protein [Deltaproteobacteria bacterium]